MRKAFFTSASFSYLDRVRVLVATLRRHHPEWEIWLCVVDEQPPNLTIDLHAEGVDEVRNVRQLAIPDVDAWVFSHDIVELCTAVKGPMLCAMIEDGVDKIIYLDPDIAVFSPLSEVESLLDQDGAVLTPHLLAPEQSEQGIEDNEISALKHGIYNLGFLAIPNRPQGRRTASWWRDRLLRYCYDDPARGLFVDQRWCDHMPALFPETRILHHAGYNAASWNISQRPISIGLDGKIRAGSDELRFFHFTKLTSAGRAMLERYAGDNFDVLEIAAWYAASLSRARVEGLPKGWWAYSTYANGRQISREDRIAFRKLRSLGRAPASPFHSAEPISQAYTLP